MSLPLIIGSKLVDAFWLKHDEQDDNSSSLDFIKIIRII